MNKRLQFLESLLIATGTSKSGLATLMGVSAQNIFTYFKRDDMKISYAQEIASRLGYELVFRLEKAGESVASSASIDLENLIGGNGISRLAFLRVAMGQYGIERKKLAEQLGIGYGGLSRWFKVDDISISYIFKIAELYGLTFKVKAAPKKVQTPAGLDLV